MLGFTTASRFLVAASQTTVSLLSSFFEGGFARARKSQ